jgi:uncharacterized coiled-coil DUF342 family protein
MKLLQKKDSLMKKINILVKEYDDIHEELDRTATKTRKVTPKSNKLRKNKKDDEGCCIS